MNRFYVALTGERYMTDEEKATRRAEQAEIRAAIQADAERKGKEELLSPILVLEIE